ncbi:MAG TPA: hypothetical protein VMU97_00960 [Candidatus Dormibacteraeota bacterium]|nr:hypothetical protein [Candidatus Dormibacteraeota bacterium]
MLYRVGEAVYDETMKLFHRQNTNASVPGEPGSSEREDQVKRAWRAMAIRILISALVIVAIALAAAWALRSAQHTTTSRPKTPAKTATSGAKTPQASKPKTSQPSKTSGPSSSAATGSPTHPATAPAGGNLTNTGPGDVIGWFVATSLSATGFYYFVVLRRYKAE